MRRAFNLIAAIILVATPVVAQVPEAFSVFIQNAPIATTPFSSSDGIPIVQGGRTHRLPVQGTGAVMLQDGSNGLQPNTPKNLRTAPIDVRNFGAKCDWNGTTGTDDTTAIQAALDWSVASPGSSITGQTGAQCRITATLTVRKSYSAWIVPVFPGTHHDGGSTAALDTNFSLAWDGAAGGTMMDIEPAAGAGALVGNAVKGVAFLCRSIAAYGLVLKSIRYSDIDVFEHECTTSGVLTTTVSAAVFGENLDFFFGRVRVDGYQEANSGYILQMTGTAQGNSDYNDVWVTGSYKNQTGLFLGDSDNNRVWAPHLFKRPGGSATYGLDCAGSASGACRSNKFFGLDSVTVFRGTGNPGGATTGNIIFGTDLTNSLVDPVVETGAVMTLFRDDGSADMGKFTQIANDTSNEFAVIKAKAASGGGNRVQVQGSWVSLGGTNPLSGTLALGQTGNNTVQVAPLNTLNNTGHPFGMGNYAYFDQDLGNEVAIFGAATAAGGGNRGQIKTTDLRIGLTWASPNFLFDSINSILTIAGGTPEIVLGGDTSGSLGLRAANAGGTNIIRFPNGSTDFSATGGAGQVLKQLTAGGPITVGVPAGIASCTVALAGATITITNGAITALTGC